MEKLAIKGGIPVRAGKLFYGRQWIDSKDIEAVSSVLRSDFITCGPKVDEFEELLTEYTGAKYAVAVSSGTAALHCACVAAGIGQGDEVITTPLTFAASANCVLYCGGTPVFADVDTDTYNIDPRSIEEKITDKTKAIIAVDFTGQVVNQKEIRKICDKYNLLFIEDAAHSIGSKFEEMQVGSFADMTCFSFHPVKTITGGEGGAITTNDEELYKRLVLAHAHGIVRDRNMLPDEDDIGAWYYDEVSLGYNYRMTDFQAALLSSQLEKLDFFVSRRKEIVNRYNMEFENIPEIIIQKEIPEADTCRHLYIIRLNKEKLNCTRKEFFDAMSMENIQCQVHYIPVYWFSYYKKLGYEKGLCKNAEEIYKGIMSIPLYPKMTDQDVEDVIHAVKKVVNNYRK
nr:UDP-4-amino-4,6-dideoxy-N-acetyl-beta-L-altrosamine transaminase [uncultured Catonella sp.]